MGGEGCSDLSLLPPRDPRSRPLPSTPPPSLRGAPAGSKISNSRNAPIRAATFLSRADPGAAFFTDEVFS